MYETKFMQRALELSRQGMQTGHGGPFGCVIVKDGIVVGEAHNEVSSSKSKRGRPMSARPMASICCWPPDNCHAN